MRRAKIVCTLGPATSDPQVVEELVLAGMDVARINLSHGDYTDHQHSIDAVRAATDSTGRGVAVLADLQGPKIRLGRFADGPATLDVGAEFIITTDDVAGDATRASTTYEGLAGDVLADDLLLIDDGKILLRAVSVSGNDVITEVLEGGVVSDSKGINLPGVSVSVPALSGKDRDDLRWALQSGVDLVALSFVREAADITVVHQIMDEVGVRVPVLAKIEKPQGVDNLAEIIATFDGIMVARGDLGVELPIEEVPLVQKQAIAMCRNAGKPVIVATQMLDSMVTARRPTRAEASDVANAVLDGTDALMLSAETSVGDHPVVVVETMARIISHVEEQSLGHFHEVEEIRLGSTARALTKAACQVGEAVRATHLCTFTETGLTPRLVARHRSPIPLVAFTPSQRVRSQLSLVWGVETFLTPHAGSTDGMVELVDHELLRLARNQPGDRVVVIAGVPPGIAGTTNGMRVHVMGTQEIDKPRR
ncbi:MAG: pyruvate kinase [Actinobacteria bacterium]|nr:pyruvate kinase [Actinomycetota bacterium]